MNEASGSVRLVNPVAPMQKLHRLNAATVNLARRGLSGEFGRQLVSADPALAAQLAKDGVTPEMRYALAVRLVAETAPLRILPKERIVGAATYREAAYHATPIHGEASTSHLTLGFDRILPLGYKGLRLEIEQRRARKNLDAQGEDLLQSMLVCLDAAGIWHRRYVALLEERISRSAGDQREHYRQVLANLRNVPEHAPETFGGAVQSLWFMFAFQRLCGNWSGIGRIDQMLAPYLKRDLRANHITLDEAREILAHFWIKGTEWIIRDADTAPGSGDAQHYQNIVLSGIDAQGRDVTNEVTYLVLDVVEELHISDFPIGVRLSARSPEKLLRRVAEVQSLGGGIVSIYNEDVAISGLVKFGIPLAEARGFANDGCWEVILPGKTAFSYQPFDLLIALQQILGLDQDQGAVPAYRDFDELYGAFLARLGKTLDGVHLEIDSAFTDGPPATLISLLIEDCIENGRGYYDRGARYNVVAPHAGGMADAADSLVVIKKLVFDERHLTLPEFVDILRADWKNHEALRRQIRKTMPAYGNDDTEADVMMLRLFHDYTELVGRMPFREGVYRPAGISSFGREIEWRAHRKAMAHGFRKGEILATNFSPTPGTQKEGPLAAIKSYCKADFTRLPNGGTLEIRLHPSCVKDAAGIHALMGILKAFLRLGGFYLNVDVIDAALLRDAQKHPEKYPNLVVRIAGWCARFHTLNKDWQEMVIRRAEQPG